MARAHFTVKIGAAADVTPFAGVLSVEELFPRFAEALGVVVPCPLPSVMLVDDFDGRPPGFIPKDCRSSFVRTENGSMYRIGLTVPAGSGRRHSGRFQFAFVDGVISMYGDVLLQEVGERVSLMRDAVAEWFVWVLERMVSLGVVRDAYFNVHVPYSGPLTMLLPRMTMEDTPLERERATWVRSGWLMSLTPEQASKGEAAPEVVMVDHRDQGGVLVVSAPFPSSTVDGQRWRNWLAGYGPAFGPVDLDEALAGGHFHPV